jgi:acyl dehydratase
MDYDTIKGWPFQPVVSTYAEHDAIRYALSVGYGGAPEDPTDAKELRYVYEHDLLVAPSMGLVLGHPGPWITDPKTGIDAPRTVHAEQSIEWHAPLPRAGSVSARNEIVRIVDKGPDVGAFVHQRRELIDLATGTLLATVEQVLLCRGDGGLSRSDPAPAKADPPPDREPDHVYVIPTLPQAAMLYRLLGDLNPLHIDPATAQEAGFARPIAHGLFTFAVAFRGVVAALAGGDPARVQRLSGRFSAPVYPGEALALEAWRLDATTFAFRVRAVPRGVVALSLGCATVK